MIQIDICSESGVTVRIITVLTITVLCNFTGNVSAETPTTTAQNGARWESVFVSNDAFASRELVVPQASSLPAGAGKRVAMTSEAYAGTQVHHMLYLPHDWNPNWQEQHQTWPVIVEYTGNFFPAAGSTGRVEDAQLGYGITGGQFIWVTLPFLSEDHSQNATTWWGDEQATVDYAKTQVPKICEQFGGDTSKVFLCGFSRGAIATNYIGLHDAEIAKLWCGLITHDHYDGEREWKGTTWGTPLEQYRNAAHQRLARLGNRPVLVCQNGGTDGIRTYLETQSSLEAFTFLNVKTSRILGEFPNSFAIHPHNDRWLTVDSPERREVWAWIYRVLQSAP